MRRVLLAAAGIGIVGPPLAFEAARALRPWLTDSLAVLAAPALLALPFHVLWLGQVRAGRLRTAAAAGLVWATFVTLVSIPLFHAAPERYEASIWNAAAYRADMFHWIRTGIGQEGDPALFVPEHARHVFAFCALSFFSAGLFGLMLGAALLDYMNFYVGALFGHATGPVGLAFVAWPFYAMVRVAGFVFCATALASLTLSFLHRGGATRRSASRMLLLGFALVVADGLLKTVLAPHYREAFAHLTDLAD